MKNFIFKSNESDLQKMFQYLETLRKNILYITYRVDSIQSLCRKLNADKGLQKQVDEFYEQETSPQTDSDEHE